MPKPYVTVTLPDGSVAKRQTAKPYAFVIAAEPRSADTVAAEFDRYAQAADAKAAEYRAAAEAPFSVRSRNLFSSLSSAESKRRAEEEGYSHEARLGTTDLVSTHSTPDGRVRNYSTGERVLVDGETYLRALALKRAEETEGVAANYRNLRDAAKDDEGWTVVRWTTRRDLAMKETAEDRGMKAKGHRLQVIEVD